MVLFVDQNATLNSVDNLSFVSLIFGGHHLLTREYRLVV